MRKIFLVPFVALGLTACQTASAPPAPVINTVVGVLPQQVQDIAVQACGYLPAAETVANLIAAFGGPAVPGIASQIASEICAAVTQPRRAAKGARSSTPTVHGVVIRGQFVR